MDAERRRWLEQLGAACEKVLANTDAGDRSQAYYAAVLEDVKALLARIEAELSTGAAEGTLREERGHLDVRHVDREETARGRQVGNGQLR